MARVMASPSPMAVKLPGAGLLQTPWFYGWTIVAVGLLTIAMSQGTRGLFGVLLVGMEDDLQWGRTLLSGAIALNALVMAVVAIPLGIALDRYGPRWVFGGAALTLGVGMALVAFMDAPWQFYLALGVITAIGLAPLRVAGPGVVLAQWFVRRRGVSRGIMSTGIGLGLFCLAPLVQAVISTAGWRAACLLLAGICIAVLLPANVLFMRRRPQDYGLHPDGDAIAPVSHRAGTGRDSLSLRAALQQPRLRALLAASLCTTTGFQFVVIHGVPHLVDVGVAPATAAWLLGLTGLTAIGGQLLLGWVADRWNAESAFTLGIGGMIVATALLWNAEPGQQLLLMVYAVTFGLGYAANQGIVTLMVADMIPGGSLGKLTGLQAVLISLGVALGPGFGGWAHDALGTYAPAFLLALVCEALAIFCAWLAASRRCALVFEPAPA